MSQPIDDELTYKIIGCAMQVHKTLGNGFQEVIYQRCLAIELGKQGIAFVREQETPIYYDGIEVGKRRVDLLVEDQVMVELKALTELEDVHLAQGLNYWMAYNLDKGLLINFGGRRFEVKRLSRKNKRSANPDSGNLLQHEMVRQPILLMHCLNIERDSNEESKLPEV